MRTPSCHPRFTHHIRHYIAHLSLISSVPFIDHQRNDMEKGQWRHVEFLLYCIIGTGISVMRTRCIHKKRKRTSVVTIHKNTDPGQSYGVFFNAATTICFSVSLQKQEFAHIANEPHLGNCIFVLKAFNPSQNNMLMLHGNFIDSSVSLIIYCPVDLPAISIAMSGNDQILIIATVDVGYNRLLDICKVEDESELCDIINMGSGQAKDALKIFKKLLEDFEELKYLLVHGHGPLSPYPEDYTLQAVLVGMMGQSPHHSPRATQSPLVFVPQIPVILLQKPYEMLITNHPWMQVSSEHEDMCSEQGFPSMFTWGYGGKEVAAEGSRDNWKIGKSLQRLGKEFAIMKVLHLSDLQDPVPEDFESISDFGSLQSASEPSKYKCVRVYKKTREKQS
ncbi:SNF1-related protein kinase regulatory subunit beta-2 [Vitis vinifera]|uniref:SNF1-related protein kinase regulatory subunit beta-2 n=1 Tax=Vitis vinifera TaxID=29760 RepID=A0A438HTY7_VITVI|nr:SNF1-related protein kinase regulatory subunit beta-2 [Vitis vinifera]